jgi:hypothetical protein
MTTSYYFLFRDPLLHLGGSRVVNIKLFLGSGVNVGTSCCKAGCIISTLSTLSSAVWAFAAAAGAALQASFAVPR